MRDRPNDHTHRRVLEAKVGRPLKSTEVAHHLDEDKANNQGINLTAEPRGAHTTHHKQTRQLGRLRSALRMIRERKKLY